MNRFDGLEKSLSYLRLNQAWSAGERLEELPDWIVEAALADRELVDYERLKAVLSHRSLRPSKLQQKREEFTLPMVPRHREGQEPATQAAGCGW